MKHIKQIFIILGLLLSFSCERDDSNIRKPSSEVPVTLSGIVTRVVGDNANAPVYLTAFTDGSEPQIYIEETEIRASGGLNDTERQLTFSSGTPYYPIARNAIRFFAYSGRAVDGKMSLTAGQDDANDAILSNNGRTRDDGAILPENEGLGTLGSSDNPAELLEFRHVMTRLIVEVEVDDAETPPVNPKPVKVEFGIEGIAAQGEYSIYALAPGDDADLNVPELATAVSGSYTVRLGENFLIPNGADLSGKKFSSLVIDDYVATNADLDVFEIDALQGNDIHKLYPGYSYRLVIKVQRLGVTGVTIQRINWTENVLKDTLPSYDPYDMAVNLGADYNASGDDAVTKVVLYTSDQKIYVGEQKDGTGDIKFVTLPTGNVIHADIYTAQGLLLSTPITDQYQSGSLQLDLSAGGMTLLNSLQPNSKDNPYLITTPVQFLNIEKDLTAHYRQESDIDMDALTVTPDFTFSGFGTLKGSYNGNGHKLQNLNIKGAGLFARNDGGEILNLRIYTGRIDASGVLYAGSVCSINNGVIVACTNEAQITGALNIAGGICGLNDTNGKVIASVNTGYIHKATTAGGICGENRNDETYAFTSCVNTGMLDDETVNMGGICGTSVGSPDPVFITCFWLIATAAHYLGGSETIVGQGDVGSADCSSMDPDKLRDYLAVGDDTTITSERLTDRLNSLYPEWGSIYEFIYNRQLTGLSWPIAVKK